MNQIQEVKQRADIMKVAKYFGLNLNRANKCKCLWHKENTASLSFSQSKQIFKCFGCRNWWRLHNISIKIVEY